MGKIVNRGDLDLPNNQKINFEKNAGGIYQSFVRTDTSDNIIMDNAINLVGGVVLAATGNSNLNKFVDATAMTPTVSASGTAGTPAYTTQVGRWSQIGNLVFFTVKIILSGWTGSPTGLINVVLPSGLPLSANVTNAETTIPCEWTAYTVQTGGLDLKGVLPANSRTIQLIETKSNSAQQNSEASQTGASTMTIRMSGVYLAA